MSTKLSLLEILSKNTQQYLSGQELADFLGVSRNSVWKAIQKLQSEGFAIDSKVSVGYRLLQKGDVLSASYINESLDFPCKVHILDEIDSTNNYAKKLNDLSLVHMIIANSQTKGRGRLGRSFHSPYSKGLYMTLAFKPEFSLDRAMLLTAVAALAVCQALESVTGLKPQIKWVNDIYLDNKKVCGILTEAESNFETGSIDKIIVGIGVNCFEQNFPEEIAQKATYIANAPKEFDRNLLATAIANKFFGLLTSFDKHMILEEYKSRSMILGEQILIFGTSYSAMPENGGNGIRARAIDIDENGGLVVEYIQGDNIHETETIISGEVTIRKDIFNE